MGPRRRLPAAGLPHRDADEGAADEGAAATAEPANHRQHVARIDASLFALLRARAAASSICPSEVARAVARAVAGGPARPSERAPAWRSLMPLVRERSAFWAGQGRLLIKRAGQALDPRGDLGGGPIRIGRGPDFERGPDDDDADRPSDA